MTVWNNSHAVDQDFDGEAWDCSPDFIPDYAGDYEELDEDNYPFEDWQVIALDRFGDRLVNGRY